MKRNVKKKDKGGLFKRYFGVSAATVLTGFIFIGFVMIIFTAGQWWNEKIDSLTKNSQYIGMMYQDYSKDGLPEDKEIEMISGTLEIMSKATESDYFITDTEGKVIVCGDCESAYSSNCDSHSGLVITSEYMKRALSGGFTDYTTEDEFGIGRFIVAVPVKNMNEITAVVYATEDAITGFLPYVLSITEAFTYILLFAMAVVFIAIYYIVKGITTPLNEMKEVTRHIAKGDFSFKANENYKKRDFREFAKALNKMADELSVEDEAQKSFVANVSHELKTPMTSIGGFIDGILDGAISESEQKKYLTIVSNEVKRLSRMVVSMLNLSKIEAGEIQISPIKYDVGKQIFETLLSFEKKIDEKNIEICGFEDISDVMIEADRDLVQQVIYNLLDNAVKFTPENGKITVFASQGEESTKVSIRNSGAGIAPEELSRIFERFYKVDKSRSYDVKGVGLGLYIVKTVVNMHDGEITANSIQGEYTEFSFEIPFSE